MPERKKGTCCYTVFKTKSFLSICLGLSGQEEVLFNPHRPPLHQLLTNKRDDMNKDGAPKGLSF